jgi:mannose-6-phosphate isomerase-like protein (cupin superfamily)
MNHHPVNNHVINHIIDRDSAEHYYWGDGCDGWHLLKHTDLSVIYERVPAGGSEVHHYHQRAKQFFFVLSGEAVLEVDGVTHHLHPQQGLTGNPQQTHQLRNESHKDVHFLVISAPTTHPLPEHAQDRVDVG